LLEQQAKNRSMGVFGLPLAFPAPPEQRQLPVECF
jgi:hypothetical protein